MEMLVTEENETIFLWVRWGDYGRYENTTLENLNRQIGLLDTPTRIVPAGFTAPGYQGNNYVSLYWGDAKRQWHRDLSDGELSVAGLT